MSKKQKLELTWIGKDERPKLEPRILIEDPELSYHADKRYGENDIFDNILIQGDNLLALKALEQEYAGKVKCIYIDPPFNTGQAFEHYDDGLEHSIWLTLLRERLVLFRSLLAEDGVIFVHIDYRESARLKIVMDEIFGETNFRNEIIVGRGTKNVQSQFETIDSLASGHDSIYLYSKSSEHRLPTLFEVSDEPRPGKWDTFWRGTDRPTMRYDLFGITPETGQWRWSKERAYAAKATYEDYQKNHSNISLDEFWSKYQEQHGEQPNLVRMGPENNVQYYVGPRNYKLVSDVWIGIRTSGRLTSFSHEKHEDLLERIISWVTNKGELVLDSFAGSGTTAAVAHKLGRKWITIELGDHAQTHIVPRLNKLINGQDNGGVTEAVGWKGGGGYRFFRLAPSLLEKDPFGNWVISKEYDSNMLSAAICKVMGFTYAPSNIDYWNHGYSTESDFIFVTTNAMTHDALVALSEKVGTERTLLVCCKAFSTNAPDSFENLTLKKIPHAVMDKCEWGKDDYSLNVQNLPMFEDEDDEQDLFDLMDGHDA